MTRSIRARVALAPTPNGLGTPAGDHAWSDVAFDCAAAHEANGVEFMLSLPPGAVSVARCGMKLLLLSGNAAFDGDRNHVAIRVGAAMDRDPVDALRRISGSFVTLYVDPGRGRVVFATDRAATRSPCYATDKHHFIAGLTAQDVAAMRAQPSRIAPQALYDYLHFHVIPAPETIYEGIFRLQPGECVQVDDGRLTSTTYWMPRYASGPAPDFATAKGTFRKLLGQAIAAQIDGATIGTFLSGGTDSSTIAGMLALVSGSPPNTYSIGFDVAGYDEINYARIAASHFKTRHHEHYLTPDEVLATIPALAASFDQPFGNSSAVAAYFCARIAQADGVRKLLGGDGGDEIFGGNTRYARQKIFEAYGAIPGWAARGVAEPLLLGINGVERLPLLRKARSYVEQARVPMPARMHTYNLIDRIGRERIFEPALLDAVDPDEPARRQAAHYALCDDRSIVNRMLHYDWKFTLSDNDLPKVVGACDLAGVDVGFPFLDERVVEFANALPAAWKVHRLTLRRFFKEALGDFLPREIIAKKKHGFGMPFGHWMLEHAALREMATGSLESLRDRAIVRRDFFDELVRRVTHEHAGFYGELVWIMMMLEQWLAVHRPGYHFESA